MRTAMLAAVLYASIGACSHPVTSLVTIPVASVPVPAPDSAPAPAHNGFTGEHVELGVAFAARYKDQKPESPAKLAASDGSELELRSLAADVTIAGPLAHTELRFVFHNPENRRREGRFSLTLPPGAAVGSFAMKIDGVWRKARVVSREQGRVVYEQFLKKRVDPALLEQDEGNTFSARVFPLDPQADKEITIAYDEPVSGTYTLGLRGLPTIPSLMVNIDHDGTRQAVDLSAQQPGDVLVPVAAGDHAIVDGDAFVARVDVPSGGAPELLDRVLVLVDTSASRSPIFGHQAEMVKNLVASLPGDAVVSIAAFDQGVTEVYRGPARDATYDQLLTHGALGASDLGAALDFASTSSMTRVIIVGDGTPTIGEREPAKLAARIDHATVERVDAIRVGATIDHDTLAVVVAGGKRPGAILDARDPARLVHQLATALSPSRPIHVDGAEQVWPATTAGLAPGDPVWVFGRGRLGTIHVGSHDVAVAAQRSVEGIQVARAVAREELTALAAERDRPGAKTAVIDARIRDVALANELVSSQTSLIVLDSDADEKRVLGADPNAKPAPQQPVAQQPPGDGRMGGEIVNGETINVQGRAPTIDPTSTTQGVTVTRDYLQNIPVPGRTFETALGRAAGSQGDGAGVAFSGASSLENQYDIDEVITTEALVIRSRDGGGVTLPSPHDTHRDLGFPDDNGMNPAYVVRQLTEAYTVGHVRSADLRTQEAQAAVRRKRDAKAQLEAQKIARRDAEIAAAEEARHPHQQQPQQPVVAPNPTQPRVSYAMPYTGKFAEVMASLAAHDPADALDTAARWQGEAPGDVAALIALGETLEVRGQPELAARAYGSILDLYPNRFELARAAGERLDRVAGARHLAIDAYRRALHERADQPSTYRLLAWALYRDGQIDEAKTILTTGIAKAQRPSIAQIMREDLEIMRGNLHVGLRVVLSWETDANDVDLHVRDNRGDESWYSHRDLASGGALRDDITTGFGPEMFEVANPNAFPYTISAHYYARGPMGIGIGTLQVIREDAAGQITFDDRPFILQTDNAMVPLGVVTR